MANPDNLYFLCRVWEPPERINILIIYNSLPRFIKLQNGLHALLISDLNNPDGSPYAPSSEGEDDDDSEEGTDEDDDSGAEIEDDQEGYDDECGGYDEDLDDPDSELEELADKDEARKRNSTEKQVCEIALNLTIVSGYDWFGLCSKVHLLKDGG